MDARGLGGSLDLLVGRVRLREAQVLAHCLVEEVRLLRDDADEVGQRLEAQVADVDAADADPPPADVVEPCREVAERRLARARLADERGRRARRHGEGDVLKRPVLAIAEPDAIEDDVPGLADGDRIRLLLDVDRLVEVFEDPVEERERGLDVQADAEQRADREEQTCLERGESDQQRKRHRGRSVRERKTPETESDSCTRLEMSASVSCVVFAIRRRSLPTLRVSNANSGISAKAKSA